MRITVFCLASIFVCSVQATNYQVETFPRFEGNDSWGFLAQTTPVSLDKIPLVREWTQTRAWRAPDYSKQDSVAGYTSSSFEIPKGMEKQVGFWTKIYTEYSPDEGLIHDSEFVDLVYDYVNFTDINARADITEDEKKTLKRDLVDTRKRAILVRLTHIAQSGGSVDGLTYEERKIQDYFMRIAELKSGDMSVEKLADPNRVRFQIGQSTRMRDAIHASGRYLEAFEEIFRHEGLPIELTRLVFVESSFNVLARSKVGASGLWQIMPYTARPHRYIGPATDLRNHPEKATLLAAKILKDSFRLTQEWPLAVTGYNHGPSGMRRISEKNHSKDIAYLIANERGSKSFGFASRNFFACFLAALNVEKNANKYFKDVTWSTKFDAEEVTLKKATKFSDLLKYFDNDLQAAQIMNPHINSFARENKRLIPAKTSIFIPAKSKNDWLTQQEKKADKVADTDAVANNT